MTLDEAEKLVFVQPMKSCKKLKRHQAEKLYFLIVLFVDEVFLQNLWLD